MTIPFLSVKPKSIKLKVSPRFPAQLLGGTGIDVVKSNGNYTVDLNFSGFPVAGAVPANNQVAVYDPVSGNYTLVPSFALSSGLSEAPSDSASYGRKNAGWSKVLNLADGGTISGNITVSGTAAFSSITVPTAATADSSAQAASTAFVKAQNYQAGSAPATLTGTSGSWGTGNSTILNPSGTFTLTLPSAATNVGRILYLKSIAAQIVNSASANVCPIGSATAAAAIFTATAGKFAILQSDGTNWITMAGN